MGFFQFELCPSDMGRLIAAVFGDDFSSSPAKSVRRVFSHGFVAVECGDGIGIDTGSCVIVTNKRNNVGLLVKANYSKPFPAVSVRCVGKAIHSAERLQTGKTYALFRGGEMCVFKYVGNNRVYAFDGENGVLKVIRAHFSDSVYELQIVKS